MSAATVEAAPAAFGWPSLADQSLGSAEPEALAVEVPSPSSEPSAVGFREHEANRSWWQEPEVPAGPGQSGEDRGAEGQEEEQPDQSADAFLDRVFSQLNETPEGEGVPQPGTTGHGFLKRRRMSSIGADE